MEKQNDTTLSEIQEFTHPRKYEFSSNRENRCPQILNKFTVYVYPFFFCPCYLN